MPKVISAAGEPPRARRRTVAAASLFVSEDALNDMIYHAEAGLIDKKEVMGLMIGMFYNDGSGTYAEVTGTATSDLIASSTSVRFDGGSLEPLFDSLDEMEENQSVVGWYHSHPGFGCFMSETDVRTQDGIFGGGTGFAIVIDPVRMEIKAFDSTPRAPKEVQMIVMGGD
ncbi:MAG: Mov34/MPN/PAD-1 family protein [Candidatus Methanomethylophilaceae archaeon]|jgi:proteasome lid subunit RPN8/RPN11|nr:Mov34/MPN/PAD-1 family protein [Candidatus Methanomethylophilaceae archaeon]NLF34215.1 hypothetical protein [Thermoplasmatales archaeon]